MHLIKEIKTSNLVVQIYSINPNLVVNDDPVLFEGKTDVEIRDIAFNQMGAEEVRISDAEDVENFRVYALI